MGLDERKQIKNDLYIGLNLEDFGIIAKKEDIDWRVVSINHIPTVITADFKPERLNLYIDENNIINKITNG